MAIRKYYWVIVLFFGMESHGQELTSDACHGEILTNLTRNVLKCEVSGTTICILGVRYYQFNESTGCPPFISKVTSGRGCCIHDENSCSWISNRLKDRENLQRICQGRGECNLHSSTRQLVADPCVKTINLTLSSLSSVRSIKYTCVQNTSSCDDLGTTTTRGHTEEISGTNKGEPAGVTEQNHDSSPKDGLNNGSGDGNTGVIVGAVLGSLCAIVIVTIILIVYFRRNKRKGGPPQRFANNADSQVPNAIAPNYHNVESTTPVYYNSGFELSSDSVDQYNGDCNQNVYQPVEGDAMSVAYSKVNKGLAQEVQYAEPDLSGETRQEPNPIEYSHIVGDQGSFPVFGDGHYNQVAPDIRHTESVPEDTSGHYFEVKSTYDKLDRIHPPSAEQNEIQDTGNPYNVLDRSSEGN